MLDEIDLRAFAGAKRIDPFGGLPPRGNDNIPIRHIRVNDRPPLIQDAMLDLASIQMRPRLSAGSWPAIPFQPRLELVQSRNWTRRLRNNANVMAHFPKKIRIDGHDPDATAETHARRHKCNPHGSAV